MVLKELNQKITDSLIKNILKENPEEKRVNNPDLRRKYAFLEAWISIVTNFVLAVIKGILGFLMNSISLMADAVHTASDVLSSFVILLGFKISSIPADEKHPHGHGRIEFIVSLIIALMLITVGVKFGISSYERLMDNTPVSGTYWVAGIMVLAALFKEWLSLFSFDLGERINSSALIADGWHHRTDAIASVLVAIAIIASKFGYYWVDAVLGLGVSALIIYTGVEILRDAISKIIGEIDVEEVKEIEKIALSVEQVISIHNIKVHDYGNYKDISLHIEVGHSMSVISAHQIAEQVEKIIEENIYCQAIVHVDAQEAKEKHEED